MAALAPHPGGNIRAVSTDLRAGRALPVTPSLPPVCGLVILMAAFQQAVSLRGFGQKIGHDLDPSCDFASRYSSLSSSN